MLGANGFVDSMLIHALEWISYFLKTIECFSHLPWEFLVRYVPLEDLPKYHTTRENVNFMIVLRVCMPELGRLPVHSADQTAHHGPC